MESLRKSKAPLLISDKTQKAVLVSESEWNDIQETLYLLSIPGMRESLIDNINIPLSDCNDSLDW